MIIGETMTATTPIPRDAVPADLLAVQAIYAHHVRTGTASFEETPPDLAEIKRRWQAVVARGLPYLVVERDGVAVGYAYAQLYRERSAYRFAVEDSIYIAPDAQRQGIGRVLMAALIERCTARGCRQMVAVIGDSANAGSIALHAAAGFRHVGAFADVGFKFGRWLDTVFMQRALGEGAESLPPAD